MPVLSVVTGPAGSGKTTLMNELASTLGCPGISRDRIKEGMVLGIAEFDAAVGDEFTRRASATFFEVLRLLLEHGVSTVAEAAFQHHVWQPNLSALQTLASIRVIRCRTTSSVARERAAVRGERTAHPDAAVAGNAAYYETFAWVELDVPTLDVDTTDGYDPPLEDVAAWISTVA